MKRKGCKKGERKIHGKCMPDWMNTDERKPMTETKYTIYGPRSRRGEKRYPVINIGKQELRLVFQDNPAALERIEQMTNWDIKHLAEKLGDAYASHSYWKDLEIIFKEKFLKEEKRK